MATIFDERRRLCLNDKPTGDGPVVYVMAREQRLVDNWAFIAAAKAAKDRQVPLWLLFPLAPMFNNGSKRHNDFMVASLKEVAEETKVHQIPFYIIFGDWVDSIPTFVAKHQIGEIVFDFNPLEPVRSWREDVAKKLNVRASVVDARNIVPCFVASPKCEFAAATFRPKIQRLLPEFLIPFPTLKSVLNGVLTGKSMKIDWKAVAEYRQCPSDNKLERVWPAGNKAATALLKQFIAERLPTYDTKRNDPTLKGVSDLSPYLRWGNLSAARVALMVQTADVPKDAKNSFLDELIVRRELSDNYCYYERNHTKLSGAHAWAETTLQSHAKDKREYIYSLEQFENAHTHDDLWNAAQRQMITEGKMHGFMRMYWAKKILEWTPDVQTAIDIALYLNDKYEMDGRDANGVVGVMWSICGVHDRAWTERPVFGKIRYMNYNGCKRKFDVKLYEAKYGNKNEDLFSIH